MTEIISSSGLAKSEIIDSAVRYGLNSKLAARLSVNRFPLIINDVPPPSLIINIPGGQKVFIIRGEYLLKGFGRAAFKFLLKSIKIK